jgi:hypothetical protein
LLEVGQGMSDVSFVTGSTVRLYGGSYARPRRRRRGGTLVRPSQPLPSPLPPSAGAARQSLGGASGGGIFFPHALGQALRGGLWLAMVQTRWWGLPRRRGDGS